MAIFLIDAQLPPGLARNLEAAGHSASHVYDIGMGAATDHQVAAAAVERHAILVSKDEDFFVMCQLGQLACPFLWVRVGNTTNRALWKIVEPVLDSALKAFAAGDQVVELR
ncbi:DUF5615 family PIN-like protein [Mesorhizobium sp. LHD-90]|uniref:DUF5615 family PIN-like protein n=1 Tax=Mesorhizobium sp. LHD-90 TaxID=3071414 RepID=UPI0027E0406B|nr:DUF5615 family PIN-like protein [Mesorhizobium sp. LHD-90]MDQ6435558.1 DUF5615 family PIN-like protein [Mesorhizobium sp. LHD-90]